MASRSGELAMRPLPAVLLDLYDDLATGKLVLKRGRVSKTVDLVNGNPVSTASTPRDETLGHFLVNSGVISEDQHRVGVAKAAGSGGKLGEALVSQQALTVDQLVEQLGKQARHKLVQALRWPQGAWRFDDGPAVEGIQLRMVEIVLGGLRETAVEDLDRLARLDSMSFELTERGGRLRHELKRAFGERCVAALQQGASIADIERAFEDRAQARIAVDAMILCDAVAATVKQVGLGTDSIVSPLPVDPTRASRSSFGRAPTAGNALFDILFEDLGAGIDGSAPLEFMELDSDDSGVVFMAEVELAESRSHSAAAARQALIAEHQRIQNADHYAVLVVGRRATSAEIEAAHSVRMLLIERDLPTLDVRDRAKLDELRAAYETARSTLLDDRKRTGYDRDLAGGELVQAPPAMDTELGFRTAEELMARGLYAQAVGQLKTVIARAPNEADYHAALGWASWLAGEQTPAGADAAREYLNQALAINPDHPAAHDFKGRIDAALHGDEAEALFHLERAIDLDPTRVDALAALESLLVASGELRRWERVLKRLLFRLRGRGGPPEAKAWVRLARLYYDHLDDVGAGAAAAEHAKRLAPRDSDVASLMRIDEDRDAQQPMHSHADAAFLAASTMVAMGTSDQQMASLYERHRVRGVVVPERPLGREQWALLRHKDDSIELGALMELVAPAVHALAPLSLAELDPGARVDDADVPPAFARLHHLYAGLLGVPVAPVYARVELGRQIHVMAADPPVLVAGDEALTAPERPELVFRLARALTFLWPGRAVGASRPGRVLRAIVMAVFREASGSSVGVEDPLAAAAADAVAHLSPDNRVQARAAALRLLSRGGGLNLSLWSRSLTRTADRAGLLLSGDAPAAFAGAKEVGDLDRDLIEFAYSMAHVNLRSQLGLVARG